MRRFSAPAKTLFDFYLFANFHIAFCAVALALATGAVFAIHLRRELLAFIFCGTLLGYNLHRVPSAFSGTTVSRKFKRHHWMIEYRGVLAVMTVLSALAFMWSFSRLYSRSQTFALIPAALSLAYAFPMIPVRRKWIELREIPGLKIFVIAGTWGCCCGLLPIASAHRAGAPWFTPAAVLWALVCAALVFALTVPFDVRDLHYDAARLKTLPAWLGVRKSIFLASMALVASATAPWILMRYLHTGGIREAAVCSIWSFLAWLFVWKSSPARHEYYFSFWIDGLLLILGLPMYWLR